MASARILTALLLLSLAVLSCAEADYFVIQLNDVADSPAQSPLPPINCEQACSTRCALSSRPNLCHRACGTCCERCGCVPPGTSGQYEACPCYASMTTHGGRHKCP